MFVEDNNIYIGGTNVLPEWGKVVDDSKSLSEVTVSANRYHCSA